MTSNRVLIVGCSLARRHRNAGDPGRIGNATFDTDSAWHTEKVLWVIKMMFRVVDFANNLVTVRF